MTQAAKFRLFRRECERMVRLLGLTDWRIVYEHAQIADGNGRMRADMTGRVAVLSYSRNAERHPRDVARHEVLELLLARLGEVARARYPSPDEIEESIHAVIRRLEKVL